MPRTDRFEAKVYATEGFKITITQNGSDVRGDKQLPNSYPSQQRAKKSWTVAEWKSGRFYPLMAGYDCNVLYGDGSTAPGHTSLERVRNSY